MSKIILDACNNHLGHSEIIVAMIQEASRLGADYIKFQLFAPESLSKLYPNYDEYKEQLTKCEITKKKLKLILWHSRHSKIIPMFTIFTKNRIGMLKYYDFSNFAVKIASPDMSNYTLITEVIDSFKSKDKFISCGMHTKEEIEQVRKMFSGYDINWLYCVSMYPTPKEYISYADMSLFDGFSDHTNTIDASMKALAMRMPFIEIHFTLGRSLPCKDSIVSKIPSEIEKIIHFRNYLDSVQKYKNRFIERS